MALKGFRFHDCLKATSSQVEGFRFHVCLNVTSPRFETVFMFMVCLGALCHRWQYFVPTVDNEIIITVSYGVL